MADWVGNRFFGMTGDGSRPGGRTARTRTRVLEAVREELVERGYDALSVDSVAERSGVHRATVYRRWGDVGGLLADVVEVAIGDDWAPPDTGSLEGDLAAMNREIYAALSGDPPLSVALIAASFRSERAAHALREFWADRYQRCGVIVRRAARRGEVPRGTVERRVLIAATAPLYHQMVILRDACDPGLAERAAREVALGAAAGVFATAEH